MGITAAEGANRGGGCADGFKPCPVGAMGPEHLGAPVRTFDIESAKSMHPSDSYVRRRWREAAPCRVDLGDRVADGGPVLWFQGVAK